LQDLLRVWKGFSQKYLPRNISSYQPEFWQNNATFAEFTAFRGSLGCMISEALDDSNEKGARRNINIEWIIILFDKNILTRYACKR
jgi:hypothetical protein